jgi:threonyl-tRNA synthetase
MGDKEIEAKSVTVRNVKTKKQSTLPITEFIEKTVADIQQRRLSASIGD